MMEIAERYEQIVEQVVPQTALSPVSPNWQQAVAYSVQIPWGHNLVIISKCKSKDKVVVEYALSDIYKPMGVSEYELTRALPDELKSSLPTIEQIEAQLEQGGKEGDDE